MGKLERFECKKCGKCCVGDGVVVLKDEDISRISDYLNIDRIEFLEKYTIKEDNEIQLRDKDNEECIFLKDNLCSIHPVKPLQCHSYPNKWRSSELIRFCEGFKLSDDEKKSI